MGTAEVKQSCQTVPSRRLSAGGCQPVETGDKFNVMVQRRALNASHLAVRSGCHAASVEGSMKGNKLKAAEPVLCTRTMGRGQITVLLAPRNSRPEIDRSGPLWALWHVGHPCKILRSRHRELPWGLPRLCARDGEEESEPTVRLLQCALLPGAWGH